MVIKYLKRELVSIFYGIVSKPWLLSVLSFALSVSTFSLLRGLALRGSAISLTIDCATRPTLPNEFINMLDFLVRRLRRVVRSTFAAEINALRDAIESLIILQLAMHRIPNGTAESAEQLMEIGDGRPFAVNRSLHRCKVSVRCDRRVGRDNSTRSIIGATCSQHPEQDRKWSTETPLVGRYSRHGRRRPHQR